MLKARTIPKYPSSRFLSTALVGMVVDAGIFVLLINSGVTLPLSHITSFLAAAITNYSLLSGGSSRPNLTNYKHRQLLWRFLIIVALAVLIRGGLLILLINDWHAPPALAILPTILFSTIISYLGCAFYVFSLGQNLLSSSEISGRITSIGIIGFMLLLRLIYLGQAQLIPDEAYYWNYAQHMDLSFYDHPPMVAWLIWLGTSIFGDNEFGVRISAFVCGLLTMGYSYALACNLYNRSTGMRTVLLLSVLPFSFFTGMLMTADAPLIAAWAATLYYMERALIAGRGAAWLGMGIAFGLGLLSKYTLGLLGIAALLFVILDPIARRWMRRPHPYLAAALALLIFTPVIVWNAEHDWASFVFQSRRLEGAGDDKFSTHLLFLHILVLLTPTGFLAAAWALIKSGNHYTSQSACRQRLFVWVFTGTPLAVFFVLSLFDSMRFHWTAPIWLAVLPTMAWMLGETNDSRKITRRLQAAWKPTIAISMIAYAFLLHYVVLGLPGIPYPDFMKHYFWREATREIEKIAEDVQRQTGQKPLVAGMSKWSVASALSFYNLNESMDIRSRNLFGETGAMYEYWHPFEPPNNRPIILVGMNKSHLERDRQGNDITRMIDQPGPIQKRLILHENKPLRWVYYRIGQGYLGY